MLVLGEYYSKESRDWTLFQIRISELLCVVPTPETLPEMLQIPRIQIQKFSTLDKTKANVTTLLWHQQPVTVQHPSLPPCLWQISDNFVVYIRHYNVGQHGSNASVSHYWSISFESRPTPCTLPNSTCVFAFTTNAEYYVVSTAFLIRYHIRQISLFHKAHLERYQFSPNLK